MVYAVLNSVVCAWFRRQIEKAHRAFGTDIMTEYFKTPHCIHFIVTDTAKSGYDPVMEDAIVKLNPVEI